MRTVFLLLLLTAAAFAQGTGPDCQFTQSFSSAIAGTAFSNKPTSTGGTPCLYWEFMYFTNGASGVSVQLEGAADAAGAPTGSYTALTATSGTANPATGTAQGSAIMCCDYYPWIRANAATFTGTSQTMTLRAYGWRTQPNPTAGGGGGPTANVNVADWGGVATSLGQKAMAASVPVVVASNQSNLPTNNVQIGGATYALGQAAMAASAPVVVASNQSAIPVTVSSGAVTGNITAINGTASYGCGSQAVISLSGSGNTQIIAASGATTIRICHISLATTPPENISITTGTGANCVSGGATIAGAYQLVSALAFDFGPFSPLSGGASNAVCINQQNAQTTAGVVIYDQR